MFSKIASGALRPAVVVATFYASMCGVIKTRYYELDAALEDWQGAAYEMRAESEIHLHEMRRATSEDIEEITSQTKEFEAEPSTQLANTVARLRQETARMKQQAEQHSKEFDAWLDSERKLLNQKPK